MWNPFKRKKKKKLRELRNLSSAFAIVTKWANRGLIHWQVKDKMLLIEEQLALSMMAKGRKGFINILGSIAAWQNFRLIRDDYDRRRIEIETNAVREAHKKYPRIDKDDIRRIRQEARSKMLEIDPAQLNVIHEFDILVIRASAQSRKDASEENGKLLALGHYDGKEVEMAMYDDIKHNLNNEE